MSDKIYGISEDGLNLEEVVVDLSNYYTKSEAQAKLVSGSNIKTVNGGSLLGSGNISTVVGVDMQNQLAKYENVSFDYTAIQDCVISTSNKNTAQSKLDGELFQTSYGSPSVRDWFFLKAGQNIKSTYTPGDARCSLYVYGVKY